MRVHRVRSGRRLLSAEGAFAVDPRPGRAPRRRGAGTRPASTPPPGCA
ncbi:hypothetical protein [Streptosporangium vulgare]